VAQLLVSVRSAEEALLALRGGASIIDVKEPDQGALGRASCAVWRDVVAAVAAEASVSVALGELEEWLAGSPPNLSEYPWAGISFRKLGLAGARTDWKRSWRGLRTALDEPCSPSWIAVIYADWQAARSPRPAEVVAEAMASAAIIGVLIDTWDKSQPAALDPSSSEWIERLKSEGKLLALAGGLTLESIPHLAPYAPDLVAVRGAACVGGDRRAGIDPVRVARLARAAAALPQSASRRQVELHALRQG
jgi:uncharacterized protein (UPF0264 family)